MIPLIEFFDQIRDEALIIKWIHCRSNIVKYMINEHSGDDGYTALHYASMYECSKLVETLIEYNANVNITDNGCATPLHHASHNGFKDIVKLLINANVNVFMKDDKGSTALDWAINGFDDAYNYGTDRRNICTYSRYIDVIKLLLNAIIY